MATRLVGRQREQTWLRALTAAPVTGRGAFALVEGEAGIGKSALLGAMLAHPRARGWEVRVATCDELDQRRAFSLIEAALGPVETAALGPGEAAAERFAVGGAGVIQPYVEAGEAFVARAVAAAARRPLVLAFEDLHWADSPSLGVIGRLARRLAEVPILVLATARPVPRSTSLARLLDETVPDDRRLELGALAKADVATLVAAAVAGTPGQRLLARAAAAAGNPFLLLELIAALERADGLTRTDGVVEAGPGVLHRVGTAVLASRLLAVAVDVRDMLLVAAVLGRTFAATDLARVLACPAAQLLGGLRSACAAGLIEEHESGFAFRHELIRAALVDEPADSSPRVAPRRRAHAGRCRYVARAGGRARRPRRRAGRPGGDRAARRLCADPRGDGSGRRC